MREKSSDVYPNFEGIHADCKWLHSMLTSFCRGIKAQCNFILHGIFTLHNKFEV